MVAFVRKTWPHRQVPGRKRDNMVDVVICHGPDMAWWLVADTFVYTECKIETYHLLDPTVTASGRDMRYDKFHWLTS